MKSVLLNGDYNKKFNKSIELWKNLGDRLEREGNILSSYDLKCLGTFSILIELENESRCNIMLI